jgi:flagellar biosynthesis protein FlhF
MEASSTSNGSDDVKTFRGRSLEEVLPQIRAELGPDAIVLRRREGLGGGVGGFFQRPYVEVDARPAHAGEKPLEIRSDRATLEGLSSPAVQALFEQATPFADALAAAAGGREFKSADEQEDFFSPSQEFAATMAALQPEEPAAPPPPPRPEPPQSPPSSAGLYGPQPNADAIARATPPPPDFEPDPAPAPTPDPFAGRPVRAVPEPEPLEEEDDFEPPATAAPGERPASADAAEERLIAAGLSPALAADVVGEAVAHGLPFGSTRRLKQLIRTALARRIPVMTALGPGPRTVAFVGAGGAGKTNACVHVALAYAKTGADVAVIALSGDTAALKHRLEPEGVTVIAADDAAEARRRLGKRTPLLTLIDTPAAGPSFSTDHVKALGAELKALGVTEIHLALPATLSTAAAGEIAAATAALVPTHVALTHTDETGRPGAPLELAIAAGRPLSYVCAREGAEPADPATLAQQLLP